MRRCVRCQLADFSELRFLSRLCDIQQCMIAQCFVYSSLSQLQFRWRNATQLLILCHYDVVAAGFHPLFYPVSQDRIYPGVDGVYLAIVQFLLLLAYISNRFVNWYFHTCAASAPTPRHDFRSCHVISSLVFKSLLDYAPTCTFRVRLRQPSRTSTQFEFDRSDCHSTVTRLNVPQRSSIKVGDVTIISKIIFQTSSDTETSIRQKSTCICLSAQTPRPRTSRRSFFLPQYPPFPTLFPVHDTLDTGQRW